MLYRLYSLLSTNESWWDLRQSLSRFFVVLVLFTFLGRFLQASKIKKNSISFQACPKLKAIRLHREGVREGGWKEDFATRPLAFPHLAFLASPFWPFVKLAASNKRTTYIYIYTSWTLWHYLLFEMLVSSRLTKWSYQVMHFNGVWPQQFPILSRSSWPFWIVPDRKNINTRVSINDLLYMYQTYIIFTVVGKCLNIFYLKCIVCIVGYKRDL